MKKQSNVALLRTDPNVPGTLFSRYLCKMAMCQLRLLSNCIPVFSAPHERAAEKQRRPYWPQSLLLLPGIFSMSRFLPLTASSL